MPETTLEKPRIVGINHVAVSVGDIDEALAFWESLFAIELRSRSSSKAFIDIGDQFIALGEADEADDQHDELRHVGVVVDDADAVRRRLNAAGIELLDRPGLEFRDPWGNRIQVVEYRDIQFTKADHILTGMGLSHLTKTEEAIEELSEKGLAPDSSSDEAP